MSQFCLKSVLGEFLTVAVLMSHLLIFSAASNQIYAQRAVTVTADQPNIWTLEQAHYLLAQMHRRNLDLKANPLTALDANQINGINIDVLRTVLEAGATYNQADGFNNNLLKQDKTFNSDRRRQLVKDVDELNKESVDLARIVARLKREKETADSEDDKSKIEAQITEKTEVKAAVDQQIELKNKELSSLTSASGSFTATNSSGGFDEKKFPAGGFDDTFKKKAAEIIGSFQTNPQLNASLQLDNFLQLQYEIISKQLTLLRDEVGPGERLIFLELPQSINSVYDKSDDMWAQSRWKIAGFTRCEITIAGESVPCQKILNLSPNEKPQNQPPKTFSDLLSSVTSESKVFDKTHLTFYDVNSPRNLAKTVFDPSDKWRKNFYQNFVALNSKKIDKADGAAISSFQTQLTALKEKRKEVQKIERELAKLLEFDPLIKSTQEKVKFANDELDNLQNEVDQESAALFSLTLDLLNEAIDSPDSLNRMESLNTTAALQRSKLLSRINTSDLSSIELLNRLWIEDFLGSEIRKLREADFPTKFVELEDKKRLLQKPELNIEDRQVRTVEMIPRQSSFNVNGVKIRNKSGAFNFVASFLFGFGANLNYQRQRERYSQYVQQELYSSAFGKGSTEFGWTFTSMPGTDSLLSGQRTTYAIVTVPQEATAVVLESTGCAFDRTSNQPEDFGEAVSAQWNRQHKNGCSPQKNFVVPIPGGGYDSSNDFYVSGLTYQPVQKGKKIVVSIYGSNFSSQIGVMINGVALPLAIGIAQNFIRDDSSVGSAVREDLKTEKVRGSFERLDSNQILATFELIDSDEPMPVITLVSPGKAVDLNSLNNLYINDNYNKSLGESEWMFGTKPNSKFTVSDYQLFVSKIDDATGEPTQLTALVTGNDFSKITNAFVNGRDPIECPDPSVYNCAPTDRIGRRGYFGASNVYKMVFPVPKDDKIYIVLVSGSEVIKLDPKINPAQNKPKKPEAPVEPTVDENKLKFAVTDVQSYYLGNNENIPTHLVVKISGVGLKNVTTSLGEIFIDSDTEARIKIPNPQPIQTIVLTDPKRNLFFKRIIEMPER